MSVNIYEKSTDTLKPIAGRITGEYVEKTQVTDSLNVTESGFVADARAVKALNDALTGRAKFHSFSVPKESSISIDMTQISGGSPANWLVLTACVASYASPALFVCGAWSEVIPSVIAANSSTSCTKAKNSYVCTVANGYNLPIYGVVIWF